MRHNKKENIFFVHFAFMLLKLAILFEVVDSLRGFFFVEINDNCNCFQWEIDTHT